jgi:hypothetical protein
MAAGPRRAAVALRRRLGPAWHAKEQLHAEFLLELGNGRAQCRLGNGNFLGRPRKAPQPTYRFGKLQDADIHLIQLWKP